MAGKESGLQKASSLVCDITSLKIYINTAFLEERKPQ